MGKRLFQVLDEMNLDDTNNGTRLVSIGTSLISADKVKAGTKVTMGGDDQVLTDLMTGKCTALLVVVDRKEYEKRQQIKG
jgi:ABC-type molybdate transport system substrate-binding protein